MKGVKLAKNGNLRGKKEKKMVRLKNIRLQGDIISADYEPEGSGELGWICLNVSSGELIDCKKTSYDEGIANHLHHAIIALETLAKKDTLPEEKLVMWY